MASAALIGAGPSAAAQRSPCLKVVRCSRPACRRSTVSVRASAEKQVAPALPAAVAAAVATALANPLVAEAAVSPSLKNLLTSVLAGGTILGAIAAAITFVSNFDQIKRRL